jgi:hypothetical protein
MYTIMVILGVVALVGYFLRWNFCRAWYVLRTGDEEPDWEKLGADYFIASWEKRRFEKKKAVKGGSEKGSLEGAGECCRNIATPMGVRALRWSRDGAEV